MPDIFDEVAEDLRTERAKRLLQRYGWLIGLAVLGIVAGVIAWQLYIRAQDQRDVAAASAYIAAVNAIESSPAGVSDTSQLPALTQLAAAAPHGYQTLARLHAAGLKASSGDLAGAEVLWNQVAADPNTDPLLRDFASLAAVQHELDHGDVGQLTGRLKPLAEPDNPWSSLAREQLAVLDLRQGRTADARKTLKSLSADILAPAGVRARAAALLAGLGDT